MKRSRVLLLVPVAAVVGYFALPNRLFYRAGRPTPAGRRLNAFWAHVFGLGVLPSLLATLEVPGRKTGEIRATALVIGKHDGERYLVSMLGERSAWVRNVRAAGGNAVLRHGRREPVRLVEVPVERRAPIIRSYIRVAAGARPHVPLRFDAPVEEFQRIAHLYPVFHVQTATAAA
ncbi:MAG TPA: nitroreductase/quinone reductase family protein [Dehalococcoidia bacterium]|nr:nitroreductase/quinone reductase family protein [Dehalococcoidia bacterium]